MADIPSLKINDILALLDTANKTLETKLKLPSLKEETVILPLNANHTKNIVKSAASGIFADTQFNLVFYNILSEVVKVPLTYLNIYDKMFILLYLRSKNISDSIDVTARGIKKNEDGESIFDEVSKSFSISKLLEKIEPETISNYTVEGDEYDVILNFPSILEEYQFDDHLYKNKLLGVNEDSKPALKALVAPIFMYNIAQYIKALVINGTTIPLENKKIEERLAVVEKMSANSINKVINAIDSVFGKMLQSITEVSFTKDSVKYTGAIKISAELFISN